MAATASGLPSLRGDLKLLPGPPDRMGRPSWTIHDPARNRYFQLGAAAVEMLRRWHLGDAEHILAEVRSETILSPEEVDFKALIQFLTANQLLARSDSQSVAALERIAASRKHGLASWLLHNYLFIRIPLLRPDRFLAATQPIANALASPLAARIILVIGIIGLYLASRQWDAFKATFLGFLNVEGAFWIGLVLFATKVLHELGHGYTARRYGCRVPSMGVAFLVMYPVLYTDSTDAYRLTSRQARLRIGSAGVRVELALALIATFLWSFLPEGPARSAIFLVASVTWVTTLLVNLNPFMRFDGYYLLADAWNMPNLQPRAFALGRWHLREMLFGLRETPPEPMEPAMRRRLIGYAYAVWGYRLFLFLGIALLVYHYFFKALGIFLFTVEIAWFIAIPVWLELKQWYARRGAIRLNRNIVLSLLGLVGLLLLFIWPWNSRIAAPAIWSARDSAPLVTAMAGQVQALRLDPGRIVSAGDILVELTLPELEQRSAASEIERKVNRLTIARVQTDPESVAQLPALLAEEAQLAAEADRIAASAARLVIRAPFDGRVVDVDPHLAAGEWLPSGLLLGRLVSLDGQIRALVEEGDLNRLSEGAAVRFVPDDPLHAAIPGRVIEIATASVPELPNPLFAAQHGGAIAADPDKKGRLLPHRAHYLVSIVPETALDPAFTLRGMAMIDGPAVSLAARLWRTIAIVLVRESGF